MKKDLLYSDSAKINILFYLFIVTYSIFPQSQKVKFETITTEVGLSQNTVHSIIQDSKGFMWFGTEDGLNKYDGFKFNIFRNNPQDSTSISDNFIWCMRMDSRDNLWIGTNNGGLNKFNNNLEIFERFQYNESNKNSISSNSVRVIFEDSKKRIWIGTENAGLNLFDEQRSQFIRFVHSNKKENSISSNSIRDIKEDSKGNLIIATEGGGVQRFIVSKNKFENIEIKNQFGKKIEKIWSLEFDNNNSLWIGTDGDGIVKIDNPNKKTFYNHKLFPNGVLNNSITDLTLDNSGKLWICTEGGLSSLDTNNEFENYLNDGLSQNGISNNLIRTIFEDKSGIKWIGTVGGGINKIKKEYKELGILKNDPNNKNSLSFNMIRSVLEDKNGLLWVGTLGGGLNTYNKKTNKFNHFKHDPNNDDGLSNDGITSIYETKNGNIWIGTWGGGLNLLTRKNKLAQKNLFYVYKNIPSNKFSIGSNIVQAINEDRYQNLWIGTEGGLDYFDVKKNKFYHFNTSNGNVNNLSDNRIQSKCIFEDKRGNLWVGTWNGLNVTKLPNSYNSNSLKKIKFLNYKHSNVDLNSLSDSRIISLYEDFEGNIWIGTHGGGLNKVVFPKNNGITKLKFINFSERDGLSSSVIYGIEGDRNGNLWLSTNNGIIRFNYKSKSVRNYHESDGFQSNQFFYGASAEGKDGMFYFGGINGLNYFYPEQLKDNPYVPPVYITQLQLFNRPLNINDADSPLRKSILETHQIDLPYNTYVLTFEFVALDFINPKQNKYQYMLEGYDKDWIPSDTRRYVTYSNISDGIYKFKVKGSNSDGIWNEDGASITLRILTPFWKTWWFAILVFLFIVLTVLYIVTTQIKNLLAVERLRTRLAADLHDNIGSSLTEIAIMSEVIIQRIKNTDSDVVKALSMISDNSRQLIDNMSDIVWLVNPKRDSLYDLILRLEDNYSEILAQTEVSFTATNLHMLKKVSLSMEHRQHLFLIFKEGINNAINHGKCKKITLDASVKSKTLTMSLIDDGIGFNFEGLKAGNGLENMKNRAKKIGGHLEINSEENKGTKLLFRGNI